MTEGFEIDRRQNNYGVKGRGPGVKGGSRGPPMKLQGSSGPGKSGDTGSGQSAIAQSSAVASANAFSHASASSSAAGMGTETEKACEFRDKVKAVTHCDVVAFFKVLKTARVQKAKLTVCTIVLMD